MTNPFNFANKTVLIVGGSSGIGNATAQAFRAAGAQVYVWGTRAGAGAYADIQGSDLTGLDYSQVDVSDAAAIEAWPVPFDRLDVLVLSQGLVLYKQQEFSREGFADVINVNLMSLMQCGMKFQPMLVAAQGSLIVVSSSAAFHATKGNPAYSASKHGAMGLTRTLGQAWAPQGVRVNGIAPGFVFTKMTTVTTDNPARRGAAEDRIPLGRIGTPVEIAGVALFLASPLSSYVVGQTILVDGGMLL